MKRVGTYLYVHKSNIKELFYHISDRESDLIKIALYKANEMFDYEIIKYDKHNMKLSLISSHDWNAANEPTVGDSMIINLNTAKVKYIKGRKTNPQIYHSKELFVSSDYKGFDVEKAKQRTKEWNSIPDIKEHKKKIGNKNYWVELLKANGMEV